ncbi:hypothetical protein [Nocardia sp. NPDC004260]
MRVLQPQPGDGREVVGNPVAEHGQRRPHGSDLGGGGLLSAAVLAAVSSRAAGRALRRRSSQRTRIRNT